VVGQEASEALGHAIADPSVFLRSAWLIAFLPVVSALLTLFAGKRTPGQGSVYGIAAIGAGFAMSLGVLATFVGGERGGGSSSSGTAARRAGQKGNGRGSSGASAIHSGVPGGR